MKLEDRRSLENEQEKKEGLKTFGLTTTSSSSARWDDHMKGERQKKRKTFGITFEAWFGEEGHV